MCRSYKAFLSVALALCLNFAYIPVVKADSLDNFDIESGENGGSFLMVNNKIVVSGGEVIVSGASTKPITISGDAKVTLSDVNINSENGPAIEITSGVKAEIVLDGENELIGKDKGAGIKVGYENSSNMASLTISGDGVLKAIGGANGGAGIGGNGTKNSGALYGNIIIESGTIAAKAQKSSAGIGGGTGQINTVNTEKMPGKITINGGEVSAIGNDGSAGIGGGNYIGTDIEITGGTLNDVEGGAYAAGIGGGKGSAAVNIDISGGDFDNIKGYESSKEEGLGGAAIGTGADVNGSSSKAKLTIKISNGNIKKAVAGWGASGIGNGAKNESKNKVAVSDTVRLASIELKGEDMVDMNKKTEEEPVQEIMDSNNDSDQIIKMWGCMVGGATMALLGLLLVKRLLRK